MLKPTKHNQKRNKECMYVFRRRSSLLIGFRSAMSVSGDLWKTYINLQKCSKRLNGNSAVNVTSVLRFLHNQSKLTEFLASISVWFGCVYAKKYPFLNTRTETDIFLKNWVYRIVQYGMNTETKGWSVCVTQLFVDTSNRNLNEWVTTQ